jgi:hypothetical protein
MIKALDAFADRLVAAVVPKTTAGACPCNDCYYTTCSGGCKRCCSNCYCTSTSCSSCSYPWWYC